MTLTNLTGKTMMETLMMACTGIKLMIMGTIRDRSIVAPLITILSITKYHPTRSTHSLPPSTRTMRAMLGLGFQLVHTTVLLLATSSQLQLTTTLPVITTQVMATAAAKDPATVIEAMAMTKGMGSTMTIVMTTAVT